MNDGDEESYEQHQVKRNAIQCVFRLAGGTFFLSGSTKMTSLFAQDQRYLIMAIPATLRVCRSIFFLRLKKCS